MATAPDDTTDSPYCHDNWWFDEQAADDSDEATDDTTDTRATPLSDRSVAASTMMHQEVLALADPICARSKREADEDVELSEPTFYLPKQRDHGDRIEEYRQHNQPRRINEETGYVAGGETTSVGLPELDKDTYQQAVRNVLVRLGFLEAHREDWFEHADRLYHDPTCNSTRALRLVTQRKLAYDAVTVLPRSPPIDPVDNCGLHSRRRLAGRAPLRERLLQDGKTSYGRSRTCARLLRRDLSTRGRVRLAGAGL